VSYELPQDFHVNMRRDGERVEVVMTGELDLDGASRLAADMAEALDAQVSEVVVDARGITFIDSAGLRSLLAARDLAARNATAFRIIEPSESMQWAARVAGVADLLSAGG